MAIGAGKRGPITDVLQSAFFGLFSGKTPDKYGWLEPVETAANARRRSLVFQEHQLAAKTLFQKVWERHEVVPETADTPAVLFIDLHLVHEVTSPQAFSVLRERGLPVRRLDLTLATMDHSTPTRTEQVFGNAPITIESAAKQIHALEKNAAEFGVELLGLRNDLRGIVHIIGPELGATQPGKTIVCGDCHTSTHGAFGALAFGIGTTEVGHVLATQCLLQRKPKTLAINVSGKLRPGVTAKDLVLAIIGKIGVSGGTGYVLEFRGEAIRALTMDERMTICNMSIEAGARAGMVAPDDVDVRLHEGPPACAAGRGVGRGGRRVAHPALRSGRRVRPRSGYRRERRRADDHLRHSPRHGRPDLGLACRLAPPIRCSTRRSPTWASPPARRSAVMPSTSCSSAAAPTRA